MREALGCVTGGMKDALALMGGGGFIPPSMKEKPKFWVRCCSDTKLFSLLTGAPSAIKRTMLLRLASLPVCVRPMSTPPPDGRGRELSGSKGFSGLKLPVRGLSPGRIFMFCGSGPMWWGRWLTAESDLAEP